MLDARRRFEYINNFATSEQIERWRQRVREIFWKQCSYRCEHTTKSVPEHEPMLAFRRIAGHIKYIYEIKLHTYYQVIYEV